MAKARVELTEGMSYSLRGRTYVKGQPQILTDADEIHQAKLAGSTLKVTMLDDAPAKKKPSAPPAKKPKPEPKPEPKAAEPEPEPEPKPEPAPKPKGKKKKPLKRKKS